MRVPASEAEIHRARLLELVPEGLEELEDGTWVELSVYGDADRGFRLRALYEAVVTTVVDDGWEERWRAFHRPVRAGGLWIGPPWEAPPAGEPVVVVDPGRAFGTGAHPTTRLCAELLARSERGAVLDAGCGSGVLAVAAAVLGFEPVVAVDVDPEALAAARETARRNAVEIEVVRRDVLHDPLPRADLVVANIELRVVEAVLGRQPAERAITSGYLAHESPDVRGWEVLERVELEGWAADLLRRG